MQKRVELFIKNLRRRFREENQGLYSKQDYREAERKYIKWYLNDDF